MRKQAEIEDVHIHDLRVGLTYREFENHKKRLRRRLRRVLREMGLRVADLFTTSHRGEGR